MGRSPSLQAPDGVQAESAIGRPRSLLKQGGTLLLATLAAAMCVGASAATNDWAGSRSCRTCHATFYEKWATSHHGLAMQPFTPELARAKLTPQTNEITAGESRYRADLAAVPPAVRERSDAGEKRHTIAHAMGGKNVFYFLTSLDGGKLQTLPVAYDVRRKEWFDTATSAMRHFAIPNERLDWRERPYTFNTACHGCHVSQLSKNYDLATDTYRTTWREPGINCETCHNAGEEHIRVCAAAGEGKAPSDLKIVSTRTMTPAQRNDLCSTCHAKMYPLTGSYAPGDRFFDHFGVATLEDRDFHPDGRDLGENYTLTGWLMNPCARSGKLDCLHCHTSSGRFRFSAAPDDSCLPCHAERVQAAAEHSRHRAGSPGSRCVACHMPQTEFGRMIRSDHSARPPTPAATVAFGSPNACTICHADQPAGWADRHVREWHTGDYQAPVLYRAGLVAAARSNDWRRLPEILGYVAATNSDEVVATSLARLLVTCADARQWPPLREALRSRSPLLRSAAARRLGGDLESAETRAALLAATADEYRVVRVEAAAALAEHPQPEADPKLRAQRERAVEEYLAMLRARPDDYVSHYNLGNYHMSQGRADAALAEFGISTRLEPSAVAAWVNASLVYAQTRQPGKAEDALRRALKVEPRNAAVNFNLGLLMAEKGDLGEAERRLRAALRFDPALAAAAYNLAVLVADRKPDEAVSLCREAAQRQPGEPKYAYTLAFYQRQRNDAQAAAQTLRELVKRHPDYADGWMLLGDLYESQEKWAEAAALYREALATRTLPEAAALAVQRKLRALPAGR